MDVKMCHEFSKFHLSNHIIINHINEVNICKYFEMTFTSHQAFHIVIKCLKLFLMLKWITGKWNAKKYSSGVFFYIQKRSDYRKRNWSCCEKSHRHEFLNKIMIEKLTTDAGLILWTEFHHSVLVKSMFVQDVSLSQVV